VVLYCCKAGKSSLIGKRHIMGERSTSSREGIFTINVYILLTKREGRTGRISAQGLDSTDRAQRGPYKKDRGPLFSQYGPEQAWLIRDLLHD